jgi:response regulator RpfG family c-di-GMP phosphodiesterase
MPYTVLLVDDEPNVLAGLQRALRKEPYLIFSATSAEMALVVLQARTVDVVISDQDMPGMRGADFLAKVRQEFPDTVRFMLTGKPTSKSPCRRSMKAPSAAFSRSPAIRWSWPSPSNRRCISGP